MGKFYSTKTYNNDTGLSCVFRQWKATHSHCSTLHGYAIGIKLTFTCDELDERNWVQDFGGLKEFKTWMKHMFDHTVIIAEDDPMRRQIENLHSATKEKLMDIRIVPASGCEKFAEMAFNKMQEILDSTEQLNPTAKVHSVEVFEHGANSAIYARGD